MSVFHENYTLGLIKEVGEDDVLLTVNNIDIVVPLSEGNRQAVLDAVTEGVFLIPYDSKKN